MLSDPDAFLSSPNPSRSPSSTASSSTLVNLKELAGTKDVKTKAELTASVQAIQPLFEDLLHSSSQHASRLAALFCY
jgi:hypothetical protein